MIVDSPLPLPYGEWWQGELPTIKTLVVGLGHYSRVGKDTLADMLLEELPKTWRGCRAAKIPFARKLKEICHELYAWDGHREPDWYDTPEGQAARDVPLPTIGKTPVQLWVDFGTPAVRERVYPETWTSYVLNTPRPLDVLIVPDVRFENETAKIRERGGFLVKVTRPGVVPRNTVADRALLGWFGWDYTVVNRGGLEHLRREAKELARLLTPAECPP